MTAIVEEIKIAGNPLLAILLTVSGNLEKDKTKKKERQTNINKKCNFVNVKSITNILLIVMALGIVLPKGTLPSIVHIPDLIAHFYEHRTENEQISLLDFIAEHAGQPNHEHKDKHAHDNLPLNHSHQSLDHNQVWNIVVLKSDIFNLKRLATISKTVFQEIPYHSEYLQNIWQPPNMS